MFSMPLMSTEKIDLITGLAMVRTAVQMGLVSWLYHFLTGTRRSGWPAALEGETLMLSSKISRG